MALLVEVIVDDAMHGGEFLQRLHATETGHGPFPSSEWLVRILGPVVDPRAFTLVPMGIADDPHGGAVGWQAVRDHLVGPVIVFGRRCSRRAVGAISAVQILGTPEPPLVRRLALPLYQISLPTTLPWSAGFVTRAGLAGCNARNQAPMR